MTILQAVGHSEVNSLKIMFQQQSADVTQQKQGKYFFHLFLSKFLSKVDSGKPDWANFHLLYLGYILGDFFTKSFGHPDRSRELFLPG
jgi:hypothetical protein